MTLDEISLEDFRQILDVNVLGAFLVSKVPYKSYSTPRWRCILWKGIEGGALLRA